MNPNLNNALAELSAAGAQGLPNKSTVETAKDGSSWAGKKSNRDMWELTKIALTATTPAYLPSQF